jgi:hypothetical protein
MRVALMSHEGGFGVATAWLATRFEVALMSHGVASCFLPPRSHAESENGSSDHEIHQAHEK